MSQSSANLRQTLQRLQGAVDTMRSLHQLLLDRIEFVRVGGESALSPEGDPGRSDLPPSESDEEEQGRVDRSITLMVQTLALREQLQANLAALGDPDNQGPSSQGCPSSVVDSLPRVTLPRKHQNLALVDGCAICQSDIADLSGESLTEMVEFCLLPCNHRFCFACIHPWLKACNTCPICRFALVEGCTVASSLADAFQKLSASSTSVVTSVPGAQPKPTLTTSVAGRSNMEPLTAIATDSILQGRLRPSSSNPTRGGVDCLNRRTVLRPQTAAIGQGVRLRAPNDGKPPAAESSECRPSATRPYSALVGPATMSMRRKFLCSTVQSNTSMSSSSQLPPAVSASGELEQPEMRNPIVGGSSITLSRRPPSASGSHPRLLTRPHTASRHSFPQPSLMNPSIVTAEPLLGLGRLGSALPPRPTTSISSEPVLDAAPSGSLPLPKPRPMTRPRSSVPGLTRESRNLLKRIDSESTKGRVATLTNLTFPGPPLEHVPARLRFS